MPMRREPMTKSQASATNCATSQERKGAALADEMRRSVATYSKAECLKILQSSGIVTSKGNLSKHYK
jgi:hypothetical protein